MTANLTQAECTARAEIVNPESYRVDLDLSGAATDAQTFTSSTTIDFESTGADTWVDVIADEVTSATLNGEQIPVGEYDGARLPIPTHAGHNELVVVARCRFSRTGEGLHRFTDPADGNTYLYTHFEPTDARRMFADFEQPDLKARFTFTIRAPRGWVVRSNAAETAREVDTGSGTETVVFAPTEPISTYLTAVAAGPYFTLSDEWEIVRPDGTSQTVPLMLLTRQGMAPYLDGEDIFAVTKAGLTFFDETFRYPYPWGKYDQIFVPEYNLGAMENPGLVTFTEEYLPRGRATEQRRERRASVIMHEMSHMWFGDLATMRWWDGLWLKESFADLMGYLACSAVTPYTGAWTSFANGRKAWAYRADQMPSTHPIVATIADLEEARQNFDGITYAKGASVIKQLMAYVGDREFFDAASAYFHEHAFGSTELGDLTTQLATSSGRDLQEWVRLWLETAGVSTLTPHVTLAADGGIAELSIEQHGVDTMTGEPALRPHRLKVGLYRRTDDTLVRERLLDLDLTGASTPVPDAAGGPADLVLVNDDDLTYAKVRLDESARASARAALSGLDSTLSRGLVWANLWNATRDAALPASEFIAVVLAQLGREHDEVLIQNTLGRARTAVHQYLPVPQRSRALADLIALADSALRAAEPGSDEQVVWARELSALAGDSPRGRSAARAVLDGAIEGLEVDADLRWDLLIALAAQDALDPADLDRELERDPSMIAQTRVLQARAARPVQDAKDEAWQRITTEANPSNDDLRSLIDGFTAPSGAELIEDFHERYYAALTDWWNTRSQTMATIMATGLFPESALGERQAVEDVAALRDARLWLSENAGAPAALRRIIVEGADDLERSLRAQAAGVQQGEEAGLG